MRHLRLDRPGRQHQQHRHHLRAHRAGRRRHPPLPRLRHQHQRRRHRLQRRQRHHRHHRARRPDRPHGHGQRGHPDRPLLERPGSTGGSAITGYRIEVSSNGTSGWTDQVANTNSTATTYAHTGLAAGTTRHYRVSAINANGAGTASNVANATTGATAPGAPTGLTATASGTTAINLSWSAPGSTGGSAITGYRIEVSSNGTSSWTNLVANTNSTATTYAHTGLASGDHPPLPRVRHQRQRRRHRLQRRQRHHRHQRARRPTGLTATASGATQIDLSWSAPASTGGSAITGYKIEVSANGTSGWTDQVADTNSTATTYAHTGLAAGDTRHYRVSAINTNGAGTASNVANATTGATAPTLTSADVEITDALIINLVFSEDLQLSNPPAVSAFTVTVDGSAATVSSVGVPGSVLPQNELWLQLSTAIRQRQAIVVTYTDPTAGDDANAIQDTAGNDAATFTTGMDGVPAVTNNPTVTNTVPADWSLIPTGLSTGAKFRLLFLSSTPSAVSSTDIADYNTFIQTRAAAGHTDIRAYSAGFRVVGCSAAVDARDNTKTTYTTTDKGVPIYWLNGAKAADQYEDFYDGSWDDEANDKNESGTNGPDTSQAGNWPLTGCSHDGTEQWPLGASQVSVGRPNSSGSGHGPLFANAQITSGVSSLLYGLSGVFQVAAAVVVPNNPPAFSADTAARSVAENTAAGQNVGAALTATDADSDTLTYTLEGADAASFGIVSARDRSRPRTGVTYNHEAKSTHTVVVKADDGNGGTDTVTVTITVTDVDEPPGQPAAPTVSATAGSTTSLDVTWTAPTNTGPAIASYDLQYRAGTSGNFTNGPQNVTGTSAAIGSLAADTSYEVQVRATNAEGDGDWSVAGTGRTTATSAPGAPTGLSATASGTTAINLSWSAPASTGGSAITGYKIEVSPDGTSGWTDQVADTSSTTTTYAHTGLAAGDTRHYRVSAINTNGSRHPLQRRQRHHGTTVPGAPTGLTATASGTTAIDLSWTAPASTGGSAITGYKIEVSPNGTDTWTTHLADTTNTNTTYAHTGLAASTTRHYRVSAINTIGTSAASNVDDATTGAGTNTAATGAPTITGTAQVGQTLTAVTTAIMDAEGLTTPGYTYQWIRTATGVDTNISGATASTYTLVAADQGTTIKVRVSFTDDASNAETLTSAATAVVSAAPNTPATGAPTITGTAQVGQTLTAVTTAIVDADGLTSVSYTYQWIRVATDNTETNISGATASTHTLVAADQGTTIKVRVSFTDDASNPETLTSAATAAVAAAANTPATGAPTITGTATVGQTLTAGTTAIMDADGLTTVQAIGLYKFQWIRVATDNSETNIASATTTYTLVAADLGTTIKVKVSFTDDASNPETLTSAATAVVSAAPNTPATGAPTITGTAQVGQTLTAGTTAIVDADGLTSVSYTYQWIRVATDNTETNISGATASTYTLVTADRGTTIKVRVSFTDDASNAETLTSATTAVVTATTGQTTVTFGASSYTAAEGGATATVAVQLSAAASATVTIPLTKTHRGGATAADYSGVPSNVTFTAGQTRRTFTVTATDDADTDGGESVQLGFGTLPGGYAPGARRTATVTLVDDDATLIVNFGTERHTTVKVRESDTVWHRFIFSLSTSRYGPPNGNPQQPVTIPLVVTHRGGTTTEDYEGIPSSVTFAVGESVTSFRMRAIPDGRKETGEGLRLDFGPLPAGVRKGTWGPYETIAFVDQVLPGYTVLFGAEAYTATEGGAPARVSIHLSEPVEIEPLVVRLVVTHVGATAADYTGIPKSVRFGVGEQTQTITVKATDDTDDDDGESVTLSFVNDPNGRVRVRTGPASATVALADNDGLRRVTVSFGAVTYTATEGGADATVRVELDAAPGRSVTVPLTKAHLGNATAADYSGIPMNVTFAANQTSRTFAVMATAGDGSDGGESVSIGFGTLPEGVFAGSPAATTVTLADGGEQRLVVNFGSSRGHTVQVREGARRLRLNVLLDSSPRRPLTIPLVVTHVGGATEADYAAIPESVTFAAGQTSAHYYVRALPDEEDETGEGLQLDFGPLPPGVRKGTWGPYETIDFLDPAPAANLSVSGTVVTVGYPWALDGGSTPSPRDFVVSVEAPGGEKAMAPVAAVAVEGSDVFLQLARPVAPDDTVTLSHLADAMHPIRDEAGSPAAPLTDAPVRNQTPASGLGPEAGLRVQAANPAPLAALLEAAQVGAGTGRLDLSSRHLTDITALAGLTGLRELDLRDNAIEDLWPLAGLRGLEALYLSGNQISDLRPLAGLRGLKVLDLAGNRIEDLWPLSGLTELRELDLADNAVADLGPLAGLAGLEALDLAGNRISDVWGPGYLTRLERLNLADNAIEDLRPLARLTRLEVLLLDRNRITDVLALSPMAELANLGLAGNPIANLWPLEGLGRLHRLDLSGNAAADPSALGRLENLRWLWLDPETAARMEALPPPAGRVPAPLRIEPTPGIQGDGPGPQRAAPGHKRRFQ